MIGQTALHVAAFNGNIDILTFLLDVGASKGININLQVSRIGCLCNLLGREWIHSFARCCQSIS